MRDSLEAARALGVAVEIRLVGGENLTTGLHTWHERGGWFSVYAPQSPGDRNTTRKIMFHQVGSWELTNHPFDLY